MGIEMVEFGIKLITFMSQSPVFKGWALIILGLLALLFAWGYKGKDKKTEPNLWVFILVAAFILVFGIWILVFQPQMWLPPQ